MMPVIKGARTKINDRRNPSDLFHGNGTPDPALVNNVFL